MTLMQPVSPSSVAGPNDPTEPLLQGNTLIWRWLAEVFAAPPKEHEIASYRRGEAAAWLNLLKQDPDISEGIQWMREVLAAPASDAELVAKLGTSFNRLFLGFGGRHTVHPFESAYRGSGRLFQASVAEMENLLARCDLSLDAGFVEPADHVSVELALMSWVLHCEDPTAQEIADRLRSWLPAFCARCIDEDQSGFWGGASRVLSALTAAQSGTLDLQQDRCVEERKAK